MRCCGVFGASGCEFLTYATQNLEEWRSKGKEVVVEMIRKAEEDLNEKEGAENLDEMVMMGESSVQPYRDSVSARH